MYALNEKLFAQFNNAGFCQGIKQFLNNIRHSNLEMKSLEQIKLQIELLKPTLQKHFNVKTIEIFGSYARNEAS